MDDKHIFNKETDSEMLAMDIVNFLQKWGMWQDVQIFDGKIASQVLDEFDELLDKYGLYLDWLIN